MKAKKRDRISVNARQTVRKVKERESGRVNLYLNLKVVKSFQAACKAQGLPASPVVEELMREFVLSAKKKG